MDRKTALAILSLGLVSGIFSGFSTLLSNQQINERLDRISTDVYIGNYDKGRIRPVFEASSSATPSAKPSLKPKASPRVENYDFVIESSASATPK